MLWKTSYLNALRLFPLMVNLIFDKASLIFAFIMRFRKSPQEACLWFIRTWSLKVDPLLELIPVKLLFKALFDPAFVKTELPHFLALFPSWYILKKYATWVPYDFQTTFLLLPFEASQIFHKISQFFKNISNNFWIFLKWIPVAHLVC